MTSKGNISSTEQLEEMELQDSYKINGIHSGQQDLDG